MTFTTEQNRAIQSKKTELLVSAAAGSGKTAVLVERIINIIITEGINIDELLVLTFTELAAHEMKERLTEALNKISEEDLVNININIRRQLILLNKAHISTIHAFLRVLVRDSFYLLNIDPNFKIADTSEMDLVKEEILDSIFEKAYETNPLFLPLLEMYGSKYDDGNLREIVLKLYEMALGNINPATWLEKTVSFFETEENPHYELFIAHKKQVLENALESAMEALVLTKEEFGPYKYEENFLDDIQIIKNLLEDVEGYLELPKFSTLKRLGKNDEVNLYLKDKAQLIRDNEIKKPVKTLIEKAPPEDLKTSKELYPFIRLLIEITKEFHKKFAEIKRERNLLDFNDLEHFAIEALSHGDVVKNFAFKEILIDEYQDTNYIQEFILNALEKERLFMVGDIKQSIYAFRGAVPEIFSEKSKKIDCIPLSKNFRSKKSIITGINCIFSKLMPPTGIDYSKEPLVPGSNYLGGESPVEIHLINSKEIKEDLEEDLETVALEAAFIANKIIELKNTLQVQGKDGLRPAEYGDMAILTRKVKGIRDIIIDELLKRNIPALGESSTGFFETTEIMLVVSLLQIIDNPLQDIYCLAVLRSPIYNIDADTLLAIRQEGEGCFFECVKSFNNPKTDEFLQNLSLWRQKSKELPLEDFLAYLLKETKLFNHMAALKNGHIRVGNLRILLNLASQSTSLYGFIRNIERIMKRDTQIGEANAATTADCVNVLSIHKSKGLEFPVVFVSMLGGRFSNQERRGDILFHKNLHLGPKFIDLQNKVKYPTIANYVLDNVIKQESLEEEIRILYVALTRAREKLILTGCCTEKAYRRYELMADREIKLKHIISASNHLDLIMPCIDRDFKVEFHNNMILSPLEKEPVDLDSRLCSIKEEDVKALEREFVFLPSYAKELTLTISQIKGNYYKQLAYKEEVTPQNLSMPSFIKPKEEDMGLMVGNIYHTLLENMDLHKNADENLEDIIKAKILTEEEVGRINKKKLADFLNSPLANRMRGSSLLKKETSFAMIMDLKEAYMEGEGDLVVHGIIDCYFEEDDKIILVDYKTDRETNPSVIKERYKIQLEIYKKALEQITGKDVETVIYLVNSGEEVIV